MSLGSATYRQISGSKNQDSLILDNLDFVARILSTMTFKVRDEHTRENLHSAGILGLVEAANSFDASQGVAFRTYAYPRIRGAIVDELRKNAPVSAGMLKNIARVKKAYQCLEPPVTISLLAKTSELSEDVVMDCLEAMRFLKPDNWDDLSDVVHRSWSSDGSTPDARLESEEMAKVLAQSIEQLNDQERIVVSLYYMEELKLSEIALAMELSESRVSRILTNARFHLKELIRCKTN